MDNCTYKGTISKYDHILRFWYTVPEVRGKSWHKRKVFNYQEEIAYGKMENEQQQEAFGHKGQHQTPAVPSKQPDKMT